MNIHEKEQLEKYLRSKYTGIFSEEAIERHITDYAEFTFASQMAAWIIHADCKGKRLLDVGSGFGSFVLLSRQNGIDARGIERAEFEIEFARKRLCEEQPDDVYIQGDACHLPLPDSSFDIVTLLNVLEHIEDNRTLFSEVNRVLRPGGDLYIVCPNYAAIRQEAHYQVFWFPLLPRRLAIHYLKLRSKNPAFFEKDIFYTTNWGILSTLRKFNFIPYVDEYHRTISKLHNTESIKNVKIKKVIEFLSRKNLLWIAHIIIYIFSLKYYIRIYNPFKNSVVLHCKKTARV